MGAAGSGGGIWVRFRGNERLISSLKGAGFDIQTHFVVRGSKKIADEQLDLTFDNAKAALPVAAAAQKTAPLDTTRGSNSNESCHSRSDTTLSKLEKSSLTPVCTPKQPGIGVKAGATTTPQHQQRQKTNFTITTTATTNNSNTNHSSNKQLTPQT